MVGAGRRRSPAWQCYKVIPQRGPGIQFDLWAGAGPLVTTGYYLDTLMWTQGDTWTHWCGSRELPGHTDVDPWSYLDTLMWVQGATRTHWVTWTHISALARPNIMLCSDVSAMSLSLRPSWSVPISWPAPSPLPPPPTLPPHPNPTSSCIVLCYGEGEGVCKPECCQMKPLCAKHADNVKCKCIWNGRMELLIWACFSFLYLCHIISTKRLTVKRKWIQWECNNENERHFVHIQCTCVCFSFLYLHHMPKG